MSRLYDRPFKFGFVVAILVFVALNIASYVRARIQYQAILVRLEENRFSGFPDFPNWGFPFHWWGYSDWMFEDGFLGLVLNFAVIVSIGFVGGLVFRGLHNRLS